MKSMSLMTTGYAANVLACLLLLRVAGSALAAGTLSGRVVDVEGGGVGDALVTTHIANDEMTPVGSVVRTSADGAFESWPLKEGRYMIRVDPLGRRALGAAIFGPFAVTGSVEVSSLRLPCGRTLPGRLSSNYWQEELTNHWRVIMQDAGGPPSWMSPSAVVSDEGTFVIPRIPFGHYNVYLQGIHDEVERFVGKIDVDMESPKGLCISVVRTNNGIRATITEPVVAVGDGGMSPR